MIALAWWAAVVPISLPRWNVCCSDGGDEAEKKCLLRADLAIMSPFWRFFCSTHFRSRMGRSKCKNVSASGWHGLCQYLPGRVATVAPHEDSDF